MDCNITECIVILDKAFENDLEGAIKMLKDAGMRITNELTAFATAHLGSTRNIEELHGIFCLAQGIQPYRI